MANTSINVGINETLSVGRKFRRLIDKNAKLWQLISWWTKASDVEFDDGRTAEQKVGNINGITSELIDRHDIAASISSVYGVNEELQYRIGGFRIYRGEDGNIYIIDENAGADSVPKKLGDTDPETFSTKTASYIFAEDTPHAYLLISGDYKKDEDTDAVEHYANKASNLKIKPTNGNSYDVYLQKGSFNDSKTGCTCKTIHVKFGRAGVAGSGGWCSQLFLLKDIPAGTTVKRISGGSTLTIFK